MHKPQCTRWNVVHLVHCGCPAVGVEAPQYKPFNTVPISNSHLQQINILHLKFKRRQFPKFTKRRIVRRSETVGDSSIRAMAPYIIKQKRTGSKSCNKKVVSKRMLTTIFFDYKSTLQHGKFQFLNDVLYSTNKVSISIVNATVQSNNPL